MKLNLRFNLLLFYINVCVFKPHVKYLGFTPGQPPPSCSIEQYPKWHATSNVAMETPATSGWLRQL
jgi:hypothetical protein